MPVEAIDSSALPYQAKLAVKYFQLGFGVPYFNTLFLKGTIMK